MGNHLLTIKEVEMLEKERAARLLAGTGGTGSRRPGDTGLRTHSNAKPVERQTAHVEPVALALSKRGRLCIVGKVVPVDGEPVLAVCWRNQRGTRQCSSHSICLRFSANCSRSPMIRLCGQYFGMIF